MKHVLRMFAVAAAFAAGMMLAAPGHAADNAKVHRIAVQVDQNDPALMNLVLNNVSNMIKYYNGKGETAQIDVTAYGPGLNMLREDKSPVKERLKEIQAGAFPSKVQYSACHNTLMGMEKREGHSIAIVPQATVVPSGVVHLTQRQEEGWAYIRP
jgi:uncharacterized protein